MPPVIGICRFSFVGRGDWVAFRDRSMDHTGASFRQARAEELYAADRMERRFVTLEHLLLKSMHAQTDTNFILIILTSNRMPEQYRLRLQLLTVTDPRTRLIYSDAEDVDAALVPELYKLNVEYGAKLVQFRIDDDDCLTHTYVETLQDITERFAGMGAFSFSIPKGLVTSFYEGEEPQHYTLDQPFHSAGAAARFGRADVSLFSFGHFALQRRFNAYLFSDGFGHFSTKLADQDSTKLSVSERAKQDHTEIAADEFAKLSEQYFPFVDLKQCIAALSPDSLAG
ncbi:glycosyltransferase [Sulfitobacter sp.]|uniref:glycosyltransferase n=1 Tax=Sulfitobacter sp. TaxID=1903071 RepID=UPI003EF925AC